MRIRDWKTTVGGLSVLVGMFSERLSAAVSEGIVPGDLSVSATDLLLGGGVAFLCWNARDRDKEAPA